MMQKMILIALAGAAAGAGNAQIPLLKPAGSKKTMSGTWLLNGKVKSVRFDLRKDGSFRYVGAGASSQGTWSYNGTQLLLSWTQIDDQKLAPGSVRASFDVAADTPLKIGKFEYLKV